MKLEISLSKIILNGLAQFLLTILQESTNFLSKFSDPLTFWTRIYTYVSPSIFFVASKLIFPIMSSVIFTRKQFVIVPKWSNIIYSIGLPGSSCTHTLGIARRCSKDTAAASSVAVVHRTFIRGRGQWHCSTNSNSLHSMTARDSNASLAHRELRGSYTPASSAQFSSLFRAEEGERCPAYTPREKFRRNFAGELRVPRWR